MISKGITIDMPSRVSMVGSVPRSTEIEDNRSAIPGDAAANRMNITNSDDIKYGINRLKLPNN